MTGHLTIARITSNGADRDQHIQVRLAMEDGSLVTIDMPPEDFARSITGVSEIPVTYVVRPPGGRA